MAKLKPVTVAIAGAVVLLATTATIFDSRLIEGLMSMTTPNVECAMNWWIETVRTSREKLDPFLPPSDALFIAFIVILYGVSVFSNSLIARKSS